MYQKPNHILHDGALALRSGRIKGQTISSLTGPWPREGAYQRSSHICLDGALAPEMLRIKGQTIYSLSGFWPREGGSEVKRFPP